MQAIEVVESRVLCVNTLGGDLPMIICEEPVDVSFVSSEVGPLISEALYNTRVGEVREHFQQLLGCIMAELCEDDPVGSDQSWVGQSSNQAAVWGCSLTSRNLVGFATRRRRHGRG